MRQLVDNTVADAFEVHVTEAPFAGSTTAAEFRTLCGVTADYRYPDPGALRASCLPWVFDDLGWRTVGLHGFSRNMFDRERWWPMLGLRQSWFAEQLEGADTARCGSAFRGLCDDDVLRRAASELQTSRTLVYVLSLNTYLPQPRFDVSAELVEVCRLAQTGADVCNLLAGMGTTLRSVRTRLLSLPADLAVLIAGDHAPPFAEYADRLQFSRATVPVIVLVSKRGTSPTEPATASIR